MWLESPDGRLSVSLASLPDDHGGVTYSVYLDGEALLAPSRLGITMGGLDLLAVRIDAESESSTVVDRYQLVGSDTELVGSANERTARLRNVYGDELAVVFRAYNDAVALRYRMEESRRASRVLEDHTEFAFSEPGRAWIQAHDLPALATPAYEAAYGNGVPIGHRAPVPSWNMPALFESGGRWALLAESDAGVGDYGAHLKPTVGRTYQVELPQPSEGLSTDPPGEPVEFPWRSPWRVIVASSDLAGIVETDVITHLASPSQLAETEWITPGRVSWSWWSDFSSPRNPAALRDFVDLAAEFGWEHTLIDANWNEIPSEELDDVLAYAREQGIGVFLWYNSGGSNNEVTEEPRDRMEDSERRKQEFSWLAEQGVRGVKVDFFHSDRADMIARYLAIAEDAAAAGLMVNFHGSTVPRGWERTWPNLMTMEAVRGAEQYGFDADYPVTAVWHNAVLPFTRNVVGSMDYTPVTFSDQRFAHLTTNGHELALAVVYQSRLQHFADSASSYRALPETVREFLRAVPATWDESRFLTGYPGEMAAFARRSGDVWFVGGIGGPEPRSVTIDFGFLDGPSEVELITDPSFTAERRVVEPESGWVVEVEVAGGFVMTITPAAQ